MVVLNAGTSDADGSLGSLVLPASKNVAKLVPIRDWIDAAGGGGPGGGVAVGLSLRSLHAAIASGSSKAAPAFSLVA